MLSCFAVSVIALWHVHVRPNDAAGFEYPNGTMPAPIDAQTALFLNVIPWILQYETPIQIRLTSAIDSVNWNCVAVYDSVGLDAFTKQAPVVRAPADVLDTDGNSETRVLCAYYANAIMVDFLIPEGLEAWQGQMTAFGLDASLVEVDASVSACGVTDAACLQTAAESQGYIPEIMGSIVAYSAMNYLQGDGWNGEGTFSANGEVCTANCNPYSDYTGYAPKIGDFNYWQPLTEHNGKGFSYNYNHVTPHIGSMAKLRYSSRAQIDARSAPDPAYDYAAEAAKVIERLAALATDDRQKMLVEFFDGKIGVAVAVILTMDFTLMWSYEQRVSFVVGYTASEYEAVIAAWNEKLRWDLPRPTTLIKNGVAGETMETYGGPYAGLQTINAQDFESYIRVMPHSEYPSASGCICLAVQEYTDAVLRSDYNRADSISLYVPFPFTAFGAGSSKIEPGSTPSADVLVNLANMTELRDTCSSSRLAGGMHFTQSIAGAYELCEGLGERAYRYAHALRTGDLQELIDLESEVFPTVSPTSMSSTTDDDESGGSTNRESILFAVFLFCYQFYF